MRQAQIEDWLEDLIEFGPADVAEACREWRQDTTQATRRPTPTDIRRLCVKRQYHRWQDEQRKLPPPLPEPEPPPVSEEDKEYVDRAVQAILRLCRLPKGDE